MQSKHKRNLETQSSVVAAKNIGLISDVHPITETQADAFNSWDEGFNLMLHGSAGTGKTFVAFYLALRSVFEKDPDAPKKVYVVRSAVPTRDMGFMPGNKNEKSRVYELPYYEICRQIFNRGDAYEILKKKNIVEFMTTSYIRGINLEDSIVLVDEVQNLSFQECHSIMTRLSGNTRVIFCGDTKQDDLTSERFRETSGLADFMFIIKHMKEFSVLEFTTDDIVRSDLVKSYIVQREQLGI